MQQRAGKGAECGLELAKGPGIEPLAFDGVMCGLSVVHELEDAVAIEGDRDSRLVVQRAQKRGVEIAPRDREAPDPDAPQLIALGAGSQHSRTNGRGLAKAGLSHEQHRCTTRRGLRRNREADQPTAEDDDIGRPHWPARAAPGF